MGGEIYQGESLETLKQMPAGIARTCITSPPYWGLRDYKVEGQLGLEDTPELYVKAIGDIFDEVHRVLADDGTLWLNLGDTYATKPHGSVDDTDPLYKDGRDRARETSPNRRPLEGIKHKDLVGIPWMVAFELRRRGWYLRADIIWHKPNPMPESVTDRPTKAHEYIFLFSKAENYYYDIQAIKSPSKDPVRDRRRALGQHEENKSMPTPERNGIRPQKAPAGWDSTQGRHGSIHRGGRSGNLERKPRPDAPEGNGKNQAGSVPWEGMWANKRTVWSVPTRPFNGSHFATFPPKLIEPCILAGSAPGHIVLDPFMGAGTTALVSREHGRKFLGIELNAEYVEIIRRRLGSV